MSMSKEQIVSFAESDKLFISEFAGFQMDSIYITKEML